MKKKKSYQTSDIKPKVQPNIVINGSIKCVFGKVIFPTSIISYEVRSLYLKISKKITVKPITKFIRDNFQQFFKFIDKP